MREDKTIVTDAQIEAALADLPGWRREGNLLKKTFVFADFKEINAFLPHLVATIVRLNHHPDVDLRPGRKTCAIETSTHSAGALTRADLALARALEEWPRP